MAVLTYKTVHGGSPRIHVADVSGRPALHSAGPNRLRIPPFKLSTIGGRAFPVATAHFWNRPPVTIVAVGIKTKLVYHLRARNHISGCGLQNGYCIKWLFWHTKLCMEAHHESMSPTCLVDQHTTLRDRTVCGFRRSNYQPSDRRPSVSGRCSTFLEQAARQCHVSQFVVGFPAATETHSVPAVIPRHYHVTFLKCNTHSGPSSRDVHGIGNPMGMGVIW